MKLMISQNKPFVPMSDAWKVKSRDLLPFDDIEARREVEQIDAKVLSNRRPPWAIAGGLFDAMTDAGGDVLTISNEKAREANKLFQELEGIDIHPAAAVATASLIDQANTGKLDKDAIIMLNITGGGEERFKSEKELHYLKPALMFDLNPDIEEVRERLAKLF